MSIPKGHFDVLKAQIASYKESLGSQSAHEDRRKFNELSKEYTRLKGQLSTTVQANIKAYSEVQDVLKEFGELREAIASGKTVPKRREYQPFTFTEVDQGLALTGAGSLVLSYGLSASYAAVAWPVSLTAFGVLGIKKVYDSCCARPAKVKVESEQSPVVSSAVSRRSDPLRHRTGAFSVDRKEREEQPVEQPSLRQVAARLFKFIRAVEEQRWSSS